VSDLRVPGIGGRGSGLDGIPDPGPRTPAKSFIETLKESIEQVNQLQKSAEEAAQNLALGKDKDVAQTLVAIEKANVSFQLMMQVRNKILDAYQEIMRMSV
jgi:flagellar hook-basal body complex protein FliE